MADRFHPGLGRLILSHHNAKSHSNSLNERLSSQSKYKRLVALSILTVVSIVVLSISIITGPVDISLQDIGQGIMRSLGVEPSAMSGSSAIVSVIRIPRVVLGIFVGAALGISGAALQGLLEIL